MPISPSAAAGLAPRSPPALPPLAETGTALRFSWRSLEDARHGLEHFVVVEGLAM